mgnify:CR=1 FL=1
MHQPKIANYNSKSKFTCNNLKLLLKIIATYALPRTKIGNPHTNVLLNVLARLSDVAKQRSRAQDYVPKAQIKIFRILNLLSITKIGDLNV